MSASTPDERICLGCGETTDASTASGGCPRCGRPLMKRGVPAGLGLAALGPEPDAEPAPMPPEVEEASRRPENPFAQKYILFRKIGKGGMGSVWKAWEIPLSRFVAIKFLNVPSGEDVLRFEREARLAASLSHPNIAPVFEFGRSQGEYFLVMKFIDGHTLQERPPSEAGLLQAMIPVCEAIHHAHEAGVIHRDLKPHNIMLAADGRPCVMDFGLAKQVEGGEQLSLSDMVVGTPPYMSPEQAQGLRDKVDRRSDVYALGATMYHLVTGRAPFEGEGPLDVLVKVLKEDIVPPRSLKPGLSAALEAILLKALEKDPARRYPTALELAADLRRLSAGETVHARPPLRRFVPRAIRRNPALFAALGIAALAVAAAVFFGSSSPSDEFADWRLRFRGAGGPFERPDFDAAGGDANPLAEIARRGPPGEAAAWFRERALRGKEKLETWESAGRASWPARHDDALRLRAWALALGPCFEETRTAFESLADRAGALAAFRGLAVLRIHIHPHAVVRSMKASGRYFIRDGKIDDAARGRTPDADLSTPLVIEDLEIDDYEVELFHPDFGSRVLSLSKDGMEHGGDYLWKGSLAAAGTIRLQRSR